MGAFHIGAVYADQTDDDLRARFRGGDAKNLTVNGSWAFGNNKLKAMWGRIDSDNDVFDEGKTDAWAVGLTTTSASVPKCTSSMLIPSTACRAPTTDLLISLVFPSVWFTSSDQDLTARIV